MQTVSAQTLRRLPAYLNYLKKVYTEGRKNISAKAIAEALGLGEIQVRKDIASASSGGRPKVGYSVKELILELEEYLGYNDANDAVLVGAGKLGSALMSYQGFKEYGLNIVAGFDLNVPDNYYVGEKPVFSMERLPLVCKRLNIKLGNNYSALTGCAGGMRYNGCLRHTGNLELCTYASCCAGGDTCPQ